MLRLLRNQTQNIAEEDAEVFEGVADFTLQASGTWDGATVVLQLSLDGEDYFEGSSLTFTKDSMVTVNLPGTISYRAIVKDAGSSTSLNLTASRRGVD